MAKHLNVSLGFTADTTQARRQLQELQTQLSSLINTTTTTGVDLSQKLKLDKAIKDAAELKTHLTAATNVQTGKLDFSKLNESLKRGNRSLTEYMDSLNNMGPAGQRAFQSLATSIANAEIPIRRSNAMLEEMWTTLKNTARWQISSSILHGFMGAIQDAFGYAQDLNKSLNDIRIVTGQSVDQMAAFAEKANKAARTLSTTTTEYTKASLIYYQQGLSDEEVQKRTDVTVKMANAAGESAEKVSDQLTAVWNNFYDGTKSLEYYADVMTALGAATASSTDEIAGGLEKFAAIGETIGLSYEYAASALATITSNTRQSEDVVGTALKTIFARIQGLKLGESLEDGTDLNKYSEALQKVGISIFDQAGELKKMDNILDEMASRWGTLSKAQQAALAQTVAGVRQYTQLIALMENWDNGDNDSMMANLDTAYGSTGALQEQADIYAESWEAARDRVTAAAEAIYSSLIEDEAFIDILDNFEKILTFIDKIIDSVGGLGGVLTGLGAILTKVFHDQMAQGLTNAAYSLRMMTDSGRKSVQEEKTKVLNHAIKTTSVSEDAPQESQARAAALKDELQLQQQLIEKADQMSEAELKTNQILMDRVRLLNEQYINSATKADAAHNRVGEATYQGYVDIGGKSKNQTDKSARMQNYQDLRNSLKSTIQAKVDISDLKKLDKNSKDAKQSVEAFKNQLKEIAKIDDLVLDQLIKDLEQADIESEDFQQTLAAIEAQLNKVIAQDTKEMTGKKVGVSKATANEIVDSLTEESMINKQLTEDLENTTNARKVADDSIKGSLGNQKIWSDHLVSLSNTIMGTTMALQAFGSIVDTIKNPDMTGWEKFTSILMSLTMIIPMLTMALNKESVAALGAMAAAISHALGLKTETVATQIATGETVEFGAALYSILWPIGLVVAAIAGLIFAVKALSDAFRADEIAAEKAAETAKELANVYDETKTKHEELVQSISDYTTAEQALDKLIRGTEEYQEALIQTNAIALELMKNNPGKFIEGQDYEWKDGKIEFYDGVLEEAQKDSLSSMYHAQGVKEIASAFQLSSEANIKKRDTQSALHETTGVGVLTETGAMMTSPGGQFAGLKALDDYINPKDYSSAVEIVHTSQKEVDDALDTVIQAFQDNPNILSGDEQAFQAQMQKLGITNQEIIDALYDNSEAVKSAAESYQLGSQAFDTAAAFMVNNLLANETIANSANKDDIISIVTSNMSDTFKTELQALKDSKWGQEGVNAWSGSSDEQALQYFNEYAQAANLTGVSLYDVTGNDSNREFRYEDGSGEIKKISLEAMQVVVATSRATDQMSSTAIKLTQVVDSIDKSLSYTGDTVSKDSQLAAEGIKAGFLNDFSGFTQEELTKLNELPVEPYLYKLFGIDENAEDASLLLEAKMRELGYDSADEYVKAFQKGITDQQNNLTSALENIGTSLSGYAANASAGAVQSLSDQTVRANTLHEGGGNQLQENINSIIGTVDPSQQQAAFEALANIDWSQIGASDEAINKLGQLGITSEKTSEKIIELKGEMRKLNGANLDDLDTSLDADIDAKEYAALADHIQSVADETEDFSDDLKYNEKAAQKTAEAILRFNNAIEDINENYEDWNYILKQGSVQDQAKAVKQMRNAYADLLDIDMDSLSDDFIKNTDNLELMKEAAAGSEEAYQKLQEAARNDMEAKFGLDTDEWEQKVDNILNQTATINGQKLADLEAGANLDDQEFLNKLTNLVNEAGMTAQEATDYLASMGIDAEVETVTETAQDKNETVTVTPKLVWNEYGPFDLGFTEVGPVHVPKIDWTPTTNSDTADKSMTAMGLKVTSANKSSGGNIKHKHSTSGGGASGPSGPKKSGGGSKGSKPKKAERKKKTDVVERYKELEDTLDDLRDTIEDTNKAADRLYGNARIKQMQKANKLLEQEIELTKQKKKEAEAYLKQDKIALDQAAQKAGLSFQYDGAGNISNYTTEMTKLYEELDAATKAANADGNADDAEKERIDKIQEKIDELKDAMAQYEETRELIEDLDNELDDKFYEWQDNNYEQLNYKLEIDIELKDDDLERLEYYLGKTEDDIFQRAEGAEIMTEQVSTYTDIMDRYTSQVEELDAAYAAGEISQTDYIEGLDQCKDELYSNLEALQELDDQMMHYYGETLQMARDEIDDITEHMEHQTAVLDHYQSLMDIQGKSTDYDNMGIILEGKSSNIKSEMEVAKEEADWFMSEAIKQKDAYDKAMAAGNKEEAELYWQQYQDSLAAADEAQDEYLSKAEEYAESLKAILENSLNKYAQDLENALTGQFGSFDQMAASMERAASLQEEYLTATNKIYETNKLMNQAQQEIDKTSNTVAKAKLKSFIEETNQLQEKTKLSQFELEIQQAKYELLLAEIALEEAQSTKTNVRLQRDNEGNFGYVYTADAEAVSNAEQQLADAQNNLYNIGLEGANSYTEKYQQTLQEMYDTLTDLQQQYLSGAFESEEEYHRAVEAAKEYYYEKLGQYSDLYTIALGVDGNIRADAWSSDFEFMTRDAEEWQIAVNRYIVNVSNAFTAWDSAVANLNATVGLGEKFENLTGKVNESKDKHNELKEVLVGPDGLIDAMKEEVNQVNDVTNAYAKQRKELLALIKIKEDEAKKLEDKKEEVANQEEPTNTAIEQDDNKDTPTSTSTPAEPPKTPTVGGYINAGRAKIYDYKGDTSGEGQYYSSDPKYKVLKTDGDWIQVRHHKLSSGVTGWFKKGDVTALDTGGYTGEWGSYGKMAMLHEKELVLNKGDTENFLASMEFLDNIVKTIDLQAMNSSLGGLLNSPAIGGIGSNGTLEQMVTIEANFPGVQNRSEIEEAFKTLVNQASQYANRK